MESKIDEIGKKFEDWQETVDEWVKKSEGDFNKEYMDDETIYRFSIEQVKTFSYPGIPDFNLFVNIQLKDKPTGIMQRKWNVDLGSYFNEEPRKSIEFGEQYYIDIYQALCDIVYPAYEKAFGAKRDTN